MPDRDYDAFLEEVNRRIGAGHAPSMASIFHGVRQIPYGAAGQRDPRQVYENNVGSCSGKHILLRDLLRNAGYGAEVVTIFTHFNERIPDHAAMPDELRHMIRNGKVPDFHHFVRARGADGGWRELDATWHDALVTLGFPVNSAWQGEGDTRLAGTPIEEYPPEEDVAGLKVRLLSGLGAGARARRARFFELLTGWIETQAG